MKDSDNWSKLEERFRAIQPAQSNGPCAVLFDPLLRLWILSLKKEPKKGDGLYALLLDPTLRQWTPVVDRAFISAVERAAQKLDYKDETDVLAWWFELLKRETHNFEPSPEHISWIRLSKKSLKSKADSARVQMSKKETLQSIQTRPASSPAPKTPRYPSVDFIAPLVGETSRTVRNAVGRIKLDEYGNSFCLIKKNRNFCLEIRSCAGTIPRVCEVSADYCAQLADKAERRTEQDAQERKDYKTALGRNIDTLRKECGWTFEQLAERMQLERTSVLSHVHRGGCPRPANLKNYADVFSRELKRSVNVTELEGKAHQ